MKWVEILANILFWLITVWLITNSFSIERQEIEIENGFEVIKTIRNQSIINQIFVFLSLSMMAFYLNLYNLSHLVKSQYKQKVVFRSLIIVMLLIGLFIFVQKVIWENGQPSLALSLSIGVALFYFTVSSAYGLLKVWILSEQEQQQLKLVNKQAELTLLRNQLRPHFLFNALNNLLSMVDQQKSPQLSASFEQLSSLLRYVIEETKSDKVRVSSEVDFVKNYCNLQLLRFEKNEINLQFLVQGEHLDLQIEPGLFIPFVENAFKYGTEPEVNSTIEIKFDLTTIDKIGFSVKNKKANLFKKIESTGTGISTTRERLELVYPQKHSLKIQDGEYFLVELNIKMI